MQLILKELKGKQEYLTVPDESSVLDLKAIIFSQLNYQVRSQKLLHKGRILEDSKSLSEYGIKSGDTVVMMVTKAQEPSPVEANIAVLMDLGLERAEAQTLLESTNNDLEEAKKLLVSGMEVDEDEEELDPDDLVRGSSGTFGFLLGSEQFYTIREVLRRNPQEFQSLMTQLETTNPELFELIRNNQEEFLTLVGLTTRPQIEVTEQEENDIKELCELGFNDDDVLEAYISCDKNKELAASYLFENYQNKFN